MLKRRLLIGVYTAPLLALSLALSLPWTATGLLALGALPGTLKIARPWWRAIIELILIGIGLLAAPSAWICILQIVIAIVVLSISRRRDPSAERAIFGALILATIATFITQLAALSLIPLIIMGVLALMTTDGQKRETQSQQIRLGTLLALVAAAVALAAAGIIRFLPWRATFAIIFAAIAYPFFAVASHFHVHRTLNRKTGTATAVPHISTQSLTTHMPLAVTIILVILGISLLSFLIWVALHLWRSQDNIVDNEAGTEAGIIRETLTDHPVRLFGRPRASLGPVRRLVQRHLRRAQPRHPRQASETLREWLMNQHPHITGDVPTIYEEVRYGNRSDTPERRTQLEELWPRDRHE